MLACVTTHELENKQNRCAVCVDLLTCSQSSRQLADVYRALLAKLLQDFSSTQDGSIDFGVNLSMQQISRLKQVGIYNSLLLQQRLCNTDCNCAFLMLSAGIRHAAPVCPVVQEVMCLWY